MTPCRHPLDWLVATIKYRPEAFLQRVAMNEFHKRYRRTAILRPVVSATLALLLAAAAVGGAIHVFRAVERQMPASCGMPNSTMSVSSSRLRPCGVTPESVPIATHTPALMAPHRLSLSLDNHSRLLHDLGAQGKAGLGRFQDAPASDKCGTNYIPRSSISSIASSSSQSPCSIVPHVVANRDLDAISRAGVSHYVNTCGNRLLYNHGQKK